MATPWIVRQEVRCDLDREMLRIRTHDDGVLDRGRNYARVVPSNQDMDALWISWLSANRIGTKNVLCHCSFVVPVIDKPIV